MNVNYGASLLFSSLLHTRHEYAVTTFCVMLSSAITAFSTHGKAHFNIFHALLSALSIRILTSIASFKLDSLRGTKRVYQPICVCVWIKLWPQTQTQILKGGHACFCIKCMLNIL